MKRRFLALALALVMIVGLLPTYVFTASAVVLNPMDVLVAQNGIAVDGKLNDADWYKFYNLTYAGEATENLPSGTLGMLWDGLKLYVGVTYKNAGTFTMTVNGHAVSVALTDPTAPAVTIDGTPVAGVAAGTAGVLEMAIPVTALGCLESTLDQTVSLTGVALTGNTLSANLAGYDGIALSKYRKNPNDLSTSTQFTHDALAVGPSKPLEKNGVITFAELQGTTYTTTSSQATSYLRPSFGVTPDAEDDVYVNMNVNIRELPKLKSTYFQTSQYAMFGALSFAWADGSYLSAWCIFNGGDDETDEVGEGETDYDQTDGYLYMSVPKTVGGSYNNPAIADAIPLGKRVGEEFNLYTRWVRDTAGGTLADLYIYVDGQLVAIVEDAQIEKAVSGTWIALNINDGNRSQYNQPAGTTNVPAQVQVSNVLIGDRVENHTCAGVDDGDCTTAILCSVCSEQVEAGAASHTGGTATCEKKAECATCGKEYGELAAHTKGTDATCIAKATCSVCGQGYGVFGDHIPNDEGVCTVEGCGVTVDYKDLTTAVDDCSHATNSFPLTKYGASLNADVATINTKSPWYDYASSWTNVFTTNEVEQHISQTIKIDAMPVFAGPSYVSGLALNGYSNSIRRNDDGSNTDHISYCIIVDDEDVVDGVKYLSLHVKVFKPTSTYVKIALNKKLGESFRLSTVWHTNNDVSFYCDGVFLQTVSVIELEKVSGQSCHTNGFTMGYSSYNAVADGYDGTITMSVSNVVISDGHTPAADDGNCLTGDICSICGVEYNEAKSEHANPGDVDNNCVTGIVCSNPGCTVVLEEGHTLAQHTGTAATETQDGVLSHWYCTVEGCGKTYADAEGNEVLNSVVIPALIQVDGEKVTVSEGAMNNAITNADGNAQVDLTVPGTKVEMPSAALNALDKPLVITTDENGKITLSNEMIAYIKEQAGSNSFSIEVKAGATLSTEQTAQLAGYTEVKDVISAELYIGNALFSEFDGNTVTIEIPFVLEPGTVAGDYKLVYVTDNSQTPVDGAVFANDKVTVTLNHFSNYAIVYTGELPQVPVEGDTTITSTGGSSYATVTGTYQAGMAAGDVFSVVVEWDGLSFNYMAANTWDPETHTNTGGGWEEATGSVTVANNSNIAVTVTVTKVDNNERNLSVVFLGEGDIELPGDTVSEKLDAGTEANAGNPDSFVVQFKPKGDLVADDVNVTLSTITVTITKYVES